MKEIKHFISGAFVGSASGKLFDNSDLSIECLRRNSEGDKNNR